MAEKIEKKVKSVKDVLSREQKPKEESKPDSKPADKKKKKIKHTHIEHHYDESGKETGHTTRHTPVGGGDEISYTSPDLDGVHDGLEEHVGEPNAGEGQEPAGAAPQATPQPSPMQGA